MKMSDIWILGIHALAYVVWFFDSKTIEAWRIRRKFWKSAALSRQSRDPRKIIDFLEAQERAHKERREAMDRHPAGKQNAQMFRQPVGTHWMDGQTLARAIRDSGNKSRKNIDSQNYSMPSFNWTVTYNFHKGKNWPIEDSKWDEKDEK